MHYLEKDCKNKVELHSRKYKIINETLKTKKVSFKFGDYLTSIN